MTDATLPIETLRIQAEAGDAEAQFNLGLKYEKGDEIELELGEAFAWFKKAAEQGHIAGQWKIAEACCNGIGTQVNLREAVKWWKQIALSGDPAATYNVGLAYSEGWLGQPDPKRAMSWWRRAAQGGYAEACLILGNRYYRGHTVKADREQAVGWWRKAAELANARGKKGDEARRSIELLSSIETLLPEAEQGDHLAQRRLGLAFMGYPDEITLPKLIDFRGGSGLEKLPDRLLSVVNDRDKGLAWLRQAAESDDPFAQTALGHILIKLQEENKNNEGLKELRIRFFETRSYAKDWSASISWWEKAAQTGDTCSRKLLADCYLYGRGVHKNLKQAFEMMESLCLDDNFEPMWLCKYIEALLKGDYGDEYKQCAEQWYPKIEALGLDESEAIKNKVADAKLQHNLELHKTGEKLILDLVFPSNEELEARVREGDREAMAELGLRYWYGVPDSENKKGGFELLKKADALGERQLTQAFLIQVKRKEIQEKDNPIIKLMNSHRKTSNLDRLNDLAHFYNNAGLYTKAAACWETLKKKGCSWAARFLSELYEKHGYKERLIDNLVLAAKYDDLAKMKLGILYAKGERIEQNWVMAASLAAEALLDSVDYSGCYDHNPFNVYFTDYPTLGLMDQREVDDRMDNAYYDEQMLEEDAKNYNAEACYLIAIKLLEYPKRNRDGTVKQPNEWLRYAQIAAYKGYAPAALLLAEHYGNGLGVNQNLAKAFFWWTKIIESNANDISDTVQALYEAGRSLYDGRGVERDYTKAITYWRHAVELGMGDGASKATDYPYLAGFRLGICYFRGVGTEINTALAFKAWRKVSGKQEVMESRDAELLTLLLDETPEKPELKEQIGTRLFVAYVMNPSSGILDEADLFHAVLEQLSRSVYEPPHPNWAALLLGQLYCIKESLTESQSNPTEEGLKLGRLWFTVAHKQRDCSHREFIGCQLAKILLAKTKILLDKHYQYKNTDDLINAERTLQEAKNYSDSLSSSLERFRLDKGIQISSGYNTDAKLWLVNEGQKLSGDIVIADREIQHSKELEQKNQELEETNKQLKAKEAELVDIMAMFAHKFRGPLDSILYGLDHGGDTKLYREATHVMRGLLDIFSLISMDEQRLQSSLRDDHQGEGRLSVLLVGVLKTVVLHLLNSPGRKKIRQHYQGYAIRTGLAPEGTDRKTWIDNYLSTEARLQQEWEAGWAELIAKETPLDALLAWLEDRFFRLELSAFERDDIRFDPYGVTASLLNIVLNEFLVNLFKYYTSTHAAPVRLGWESEEEGERLRLKNPSSRDERRISKGSHKGHSFLNVLAHKIGGSFKYEIITVDEVVTEFYFPAWALTKEQKL